MYSDFYGQKWYKGNLHTHTRRSDGRVSFEETVSRYRHSGYDFLSITDHWAVSETKEEGNFLLLSGCEYDISYHEECNNISRPLRFHINGIGFTSEPGLEKSPDLRSQAIIDAITAAGGLAIVCHPEWSRNLASDIAKLNNLSGIEIFNTACGFINDFHYDYSGFHVDQLALMGINLPVFATDDSHHYRGEECRSFIMVRSDELSRDAILDAIAKGRFFSSQGPWLQTELKGRLLRVVCTPVTEIRVFSSHIGGWSRRLSVPVTGAEFQLPETDYYYRVEVKDQYGNRAWTSPKSI